MRFAICRMGPREDVGDGRVLSEFLGRKRIKIRCVSHGGRDILFLGRVLPLPGLKANIERLIRLRYRDIPAHGPWSAFTLKRQFAWQIAHQQLEHTLHLNLKKAA